MAQSLFIDDEWAEDFSNLGWRELQDAILDDPASSEEELHFAEHGWIDDGPALANGLAAHRSGDEVAVRISELARDAEPEAIVIVSDGSDGTDLPDGDESDDVAT